MTGAEEPDMRARIETLGREVYGDDFEKFLETRRRSLDWEAPAALLERGENERVMQILMRAANGDFG
jgi:ABC-type phosphate transport system auxiliary subunit